jgi:hypothetical protein
METEHDIARDRCSFFQSAGARQEKQICVLVHQGQLCGHNVRFFAKRE